MASVEDAVATFERNIEAQTGKSVAAWSGIIARQGLTKHGQIVAWLKADHALSHGYANHIAKRALAAPVAAGDDPVAPLFEGKEALRPIYDALIAAAHALGSGRGDRAEEGQCQRPPRQAVRPAAAHHQDPARPRPDPERRGARLAASKPRAASTPCSPTACGWRPRRISTPRCLAGCRRHMMARVEERTSMKVRNLNRFIYVGMAILAVCFVAQVIAAVMERPHSLWAFAVAPAANGGLPRPHAILVQNHT